MIKKEWYFMNQAKMQNVSLERCLEGAYNVISKRTGRMINGTFVKDK